MLARAGTALPKVTFFSVNAIEGEVATDNAPLHGCFLYDNSKANPKTFHPLATVFGKTSGIRVYQFDKRNDMASIVRSSSQGSAVCLSGKAAFLEGVQCSYTSVYEYLSTTCHEIAQYMAPFAYFSLVSFACSYRICCRIF